MKKSFDDKLFEMAARERIIIPESVEQKTEEIIKKFPQPERGRKMNMKKAVLLAAVLTLLCSATVTASAGLVRERMEAMNQEKLEQFFVQLHMAKVPADNYNRYMTDTEKERKELLYEAYLEKGLFPKGEIYLIDEPSSYKGRKVAYLPDTGTFFFPEAEMSDEELLQYIDFIYKRDYSLQKINEMIKEGKMESPKKAQEETKVAATDTEILESEAVWDPEEELIIPYEGDLAITAISAGRDSIYLGGWNVVHKMPIGGSNSEIFFDEFEKETQIACIYEDNKGNVYIAGAELEIEETAENPNHLPPRTIYLWKVSAEGELLQKLNLSVHANAYGGWVNEMLVDDAENIYVVGLKTNALFILDKEGTLLAEVDSRELRFHSAGGMGIGKNGEVYIAVYEPTEDGRRMGIASIDLKDACLKDIYLGIVPEETNMLDIITTGTETDFVFWGYDGIFTYNLGEKQALHVMPAYETPCDYEAALVCGLRDGRIVIAECTEYKEEAYGGGWVRYLRVPEKTCFYYLSALKEKN